jgi:hypothetical protein
MIIRRSLLCLFLILITVWVSSTFIRPAHALFGTCPPTSPSPGMQFGCLVSVDLPTWWLSQDFTQTQKSFLTNTLYGEKIAGELFEQNLKPALQQMTAQMGAIKVLPTGTLGMMMDGVTTNQAILETQILAANAYRDYTPGENLCRIGTMTRSVGAADQSAIRNTAALNDLAEARVMARRGHPSGIGTAIDKAARFQQYRRLYCNPGDNNGFMKNICYAGKDAPVSSPARFNKDIDVVRTLLGPKTLNLDMTDGTITADEEDLIALSSHLFAHDVFDSLPPNLFKSTVSDPQNSVYLDLRQLVALRGVAQNSFNAIAAKKAKGAPGAAYFMANILREMGMSDAEAARYLDNGTNAPSYDAQMEILAKKIYQNPNFYTNLVDKPANVKRQIAAMTAIDLMQRRDVFESLERQELLLSLLLELDIRAEQQFINDQFGGQ